MQFSYIISSMSAILAVTSAAPSSLVSRDTPFIGTGQLIMEHDTDGTRTGCLTADGLLTVDTTLCGTFTGAYRSGTSGTVLISSSAGDCGIYNNANHVTVEFTCGENAPAGGSDFGILVDRSETVIFTGDLQFDYCPYQDIYPTGSETTAIHLWDDEDSGWFSTINWSAL